MAAHREKIVGAICVVCIAVGWLLLRPGAPPSSATEAAPSIPDAAGKEAYARKLAALPLEDQPPEIKARYYQSRIATAQNALEIHRERLALIEETLAKNTSGSPALPAQEQAGLEAQRQQAQATIDARTSQIKDWRQALDELGGTVSTSIAVVAP